ncbi:hypothetical protein EDB85DRAFT_2044060 [Lactarius pseudohatsudake]|nr:hypothetical protein EDB85DRAFT_2053322 [Lactarius pseudohatsudake]KAH9011259.1 hypothetical protein EDB85DRAFT_2044060 [Lactarius pseudohatsudake]
MISRHHLYYAQVLVHFLAPCAGPLLSRRHTEPKRRQGSDSQRVGAWKLTRTKVLDRPRLSSPDLVAVMDI